MGRVVALPEPRQVSTHGLAASVVDDQWVRMEGIGRGVEATATRWCSSSPWTTGGPPSSSARKPAACRRAWWTAACAPTVCTRFDFNLGQQRPDPDLLDLGGFDNEFPVFIEN